MPARHVLLACGISLLLVCAPAQASGLHTVRWGETLWSISQANGLTTEALAVANDLPPETHVIEGTTLTVPTPAESAAPGPLGSYVVRSGDTLTGIAARSGVSLEAVAAMNGVDPARTLLTGTVLKLPAGVSLESTAPSPGERIIPDAAPHPTDERVDAATIGDAAVAKGVPASLAAAIAWQESGFNNSVVSDANARGVMQLLPGTWTWINGSLSPLPLDPSSAAGNVEAGLLYLRELLRDTGGDESLATAAYYQGLGSVRAVGMLPQTRQYVADVLALRKRFGGP